MDYIAQKDAPNIQLQKDVPLGRALRGKKEAQ
jgi:hypothetical protein